MTKDEEQLDYELSEYERGAEEAVYTAVRGTNNPPAAATMTVFLLLDNYCPLDNRYPCDRDAHRP